MLFFRGRQRVLDANGNPVNGALANFFLTGTSTRADTYQDAALQTEHENPVEANAAGFFPPIYLDADVEYRCEITDSAGGSLPDGIVDPVNPSVLNGLDAEDIGEILYPRTPAEISAGVTPTDYAIQPQNPMPKRVGAAGDGSTDDTLALERSADANPEAMIDGGGLTYEVNSTLPASPLPTGFNFFNGRITCPQTVSDSLDGYSVTLFGYGAGASNTFIPEQHAAGGGIFYASGNHIVAIGRNALSNNTTGRRMTAVGAKTLSANTTGYYNTAVGSHAMESNTTGLENTAVGVQALQKNTTGEHNASFGTGAALLNQTGSLNVALGDHALRDSVSGDHNVAVGAQAMLAADGTSDNVGVGYQSLSASLTGNFNTAVGSATLGANTSGTNNTAVGRRALLANTTANENTAVGSDALVANTTGTHNTAVGRNALADCVTADDNTAVGHEAAANTTGIKNTAVGRASLNANIGGARNTAIGEQALASNTTGSNNTAIGVTAASVQTDFDNTTALGYQAAPTASNEVVLGNSSVTALRCQQNSISALSDARDKKDIEDLALGLDFINAVRVRKFTWDSRDGSRVGIEEAGVIAQELQALQGEFGAEWLGLVYGVNPERLEATPGKLLFPLIKAVQEQSVLIAALTERLERLENR